MVPSIFFFFSVSDLKLFTFNPPVLMHLHDVDSAICLDSSFGPVYHLNNHVINGSPSGVKKKKEEKKRKSI